VWIATPDECPVDDHGHPQMHEGDYGVTIYGERRIYLNPLRGEQAYPATLAHEWQHVEQDNHGLRDHDASLNTRMHQAVEAAAVLIARLPKRSAPRMDD
jgi:hypothetical protein